MKRVVFITPEALPYGFAAAGFEQLAVAATAAGEALAATVADKNVGVIIVDERLLAELGEATLEQTRRRWDGILLVLPAPGDSETSGEDYLQQLIRRALGYHIRIRE